MKLELEELLLSSKTVGVFVVDQNHHVTSCDHRAISYLFQEILKGMLVVLLSNDYTEYCFTKVENIYITSVC